MGFGEAIRSCFSQFATFSGRACRSEYWFFILFQIIVQIVAGLVDAATDVPVFVPVVSLGLLLPSLAVTVRRLHDIDRSGWWFLISLIPIVGGIILLVWMCTRGTNGPNRFGPNPLPRFVGAIA